MAFLVVTLALAIQAADSAPIVVTGRTSAPFISPMGEPFRPRTAEDDTLANWFHQADRDGDSILTLTEMDADALRFFGVLDGDADGMILPEEIIVYEQELVPEVQVNSRWRDTRGAAAFKKRSSTPNGYDPYGLQGAARYALLNMPQPVAAADANFDRAVTIGEFKSAATQRFHMLDKNGDKQLDLVELQSFLPLPRHLQKRRKSTKQPQDQRIGNRVPL